MRSAVRRAFRDGQIQCGMPALSRGAAQTYWRACGEPDEDQFIHISDAIRLGLPTPAVRYWLTIGADLETCRLTLIEHFGKPEAAAFLRYQADRLEREAGQ